MDHEAIARAAAYLAEAFEKGNPLAPLPDWLRPEDPGTGAEIAGAVLEALGVAPCGLRLAPGPLGEPVAGPMLEARLLRSGTPIALGTLRHGRLSAAAIGVLAEALEPGTAGAPVLAAVHAALDVSASRFRDGPVDGNACAADLAGLGLVVAGPAAVLPDGPVTVACAAEPRRPRGAPTNLRDAFASAAAAARALGGLPAGALLVVAGLSPTAAPQAGETWTARLGEIGRAQAPFSGGG
ncbi:hypothetical protein GXW74_23270 [Roseomonas eburnea]|uniref:Hydratase n=1 Tax=Neoroseomonas eburnea TaxID=1346889 RepID=A0A9X9XI90_9PROT|nr:hypothetical protein [Neoroseomonas eburnea]MBR0683426.1 hypothetical protein [Neoroseomonas eburnea]